MNYLSYMDTWLGFCTEKIPGKGEDSWCYCHNEHAGIMGVFDGCGGLGATTYEKLGDKTGAYVASRAAAGATFDWFSATCNAEGPFDLEQLKLRIQEYLDILNRKADAAQNKFRGSMVRLLPTTAAIWLMEPEEGGKLKATSISAGDSRNYILCSMGLMQISVDDLEGEDAMSNLCNDGAMTNVVSGDGQFTLHQDVFGLDIKKSPSVLISASDGCFGYIGSPMEFELVLLDTLMQADSIDTWQENLKTIIGEVAGDDQSMAIAVFGFGTFDRMKKQLTSRWKQVRGMVETIGNDSNKRWQIWDEEYKSGYYRLTAGGAPKRD